MSRFQSPDLKTTMYCADMPIIYDKVNCIIYIYTIYINGLVIPSTLSYFVTIYDYVSVMLITLWNRNVASLK